MPVGVGVLRLAKSRLRRLLAAWHLRAHIDDPSEKSDLDGPIFSHTELPPYGGRDVEDAIPYKRFFTY